MGRPLLEGLLGLFPRGRDPELDLEAGIAREERDEVVLEARGTALRVLVPGGRGVGGHDDELAAFVESFSAIQQRYRQQCRAYDALFRHRPQQEGTFGYRWKRVLQRLHATDVDELARRMRESLT